MPDIDVAGVYIAYIRHISGAHQVTRVKSSLAYAALRSALHFPHLHKTNSAAAENSEPLRSRSDQSPVLQQQRRQPPEPRPPTVDPEVSVVYRACRRAGCRASSPTRTSLKSSASRHATPALPRGADSNACIPAWASWLASQELHGNF